MTDIQYNVQPIFNSSTGRMLYNGDYDSIKIKNMPTFAHMSNIIMRNKNIIRFGLTNAVGVVSFGDKEFNYKFDDFRHCFYDGEKELYKHCRFESGLNTCRAKCEGDLNNSDATFKDFKATITRTVVNKMSTTFNTTVNNKPDTEKVEPDEPVVNVISIFESNDPEW